jgi:hypothetical protein
MSATRFYIDSFTGADVLADIDGWDDASEEGWQKINTTKQSSAMSSIFVTASALDLAGFTRGVVQLVSDPIPAQTVSGTVKVQCRVKQSSVLAHYDRLMMSIRVVSNDGTVSRGYLLGINNYASTAAFTTGTARNKKGADGDALTPVVAQANDRIVIEFGVSPSTNAAGGGTITLTVGDNSGTDLPEDETTTAANNPWIEFSADLFHPPQTVALDAGAASVTGRDTAVVLGALTVALERGTSTAVGRDETPAPGAISAALDGGAATAVGNEVSPTGGPLTIPLGVGALAAVGYEMGGASVLLYPGIESGGLMGVVPDPWTGLPIALPQTAYGKAAQSGIACCGQPYFAAVQTNLAGSSGFFGDEPRLVLVVALGSMPVMLADPDEPHYLASFHEAAAGGRELFSIGVTPSGRICAKTYDTPLLLSPIGVISADGKPHAIVLQMYGGYQLELGIDGTVVVSYIPTGIVLQGPHSPGDLPVRFMLYNGVEGRTCCACTISHAEISIATETQPVRWPITETSGLMLHDDEYTFDGLQTYAWKNRYPALPDSDYTADFRLAIQWYDPSTLGYPRVWGGIPSSDVAACASGVKRPFYTPRNPISVPFTKVIVP